LNVELSKHKLGMLFKFVIFFSISYVLSSLALSVTGLDQLSTVNLLLFSFCLSLIVASVLLLLDIDEMRLKLQLSAQTRRIVFSLVTVPLAILLFYFYFANAGSKDAFSDWSILSFFDVSFFTVAFFVLIYAPSYVLHRLLLPKWSLNLLEQVVFYPVMSAPLLVLLKVATDLGHFVVPYGLVVLGLFLGAFLTYFYFHFKKQNLVPSVSLDIDLKKVLVIAGVLLFNLAIFYLAIGSGSAFLRGDMWPEAGNIAFLNKHPLVDYFSLPGANYPPFSFVFNSEISSLVPFPFINGLIISAFFNHFISVLAFFLLSKILFKDSKKSVVAVALWSILSGLSWTYLIFNPLGDGQPLDILTSIAQRFGMYSGSTISPIYADGEALTRLWSLGLLFVSVAALLKSYVEKKNLTNTLMIFSLSTIQILFGHITEVPIVALVLFIIIIIENNLSSKFSRNILITASFSSVVGAILIAFYTHFNILYILISFTPFFGVLFGTFFLLIIKILKCSKVSFTVKIRNIVGKIRGSYRFRASVCVMLLYIFGLSWIGFFINPSIGIFWPITTLWYSYTIQWGVLGGLAVFAIVWLGLRKDKLHFGLKFALSLFLLQVLLLVSLNYINQNIIYIQIPYPFHPILFLPVLALIASQIFPNVKFQRSRNKIRTFVIFTGIILVFVLGSLDYVLSSTFWDSNDGWWTNNNPLNPSSAEYQLINYLYQNPSSNHYIGTFSDWNDPHSYVVIPSANYLLSLPLIDILTTANDSREINLLDKVVGMSYVLVYANASLSLPTDSHLSYAISEAKPIFITGEYKLYSLDQLNLDETTMLPVSGDFLTAETIIFNGNISFTDNNNYSTSLQNANGTIYPIDNGEVIFNIQTQNSNQIETSTVLTPEINIVGNVTLIKMKATWKYFYDSDCIADKIEISGKTSFQIFNSFTNRIYMDPFSYNGQYQAFPSVGYLRPDNAKELMNHYSVTHNIDLSETILSVLGIVWTITIGVFGFIILVKPKAFIFVRFGFSKDDPKKNFSDNNSDIDG